MAGEHVMVVIDEWEFRGLCRDALVAEGYRVTTPTTAEGASYFLDSSKPPDAVLLAASEQWADALRDGIARAVPCPVVAIVGPPEDAEHDDPHAIPEAVERALTARVPRDG